MLFLTKPFASLCRLMAAAIVAAATLLPLPAPAASITASGPVPGGYPMMVSTPGAAKGAAMPLIVFLHGKSLCGRDLRRVNRYGPIDAVRRGIRIPAIIAAPLNDCSGWAPAKVQASINWVLAHYSVDRDRIHVVGMSMGGFGTIDFAASHPREVASAIALCGGGNAANLSGLRDVPLWIVHGTGDRAVSVDKSRSVVSNMQRHGGTDLLIYNEWKGASHAYLARIFYIPQTYRWLLSHTKKNPDYLNLDVPTQAMAQGVYTSGGLHHIARSDELDAPHTRQARGKAAKGRNHAAARPQRGTKTEKAGKARGRTASRKRSAPAAAHRPARKAPRRRPAP